MGSLLQPEKHLWVCKSRHQDRFTVAEILQWTHTLRRPVFERDCCTSTVFLSLPPLSGGCRYAYEWVETLQCWFVLIEETHWPKPLPANSCHRPGGDSGKGKGSGGVLPYIHLQPGKQTVKQGV